MTDEDGQVDAWIDFNRDGTFNVRDYIDLAKLLRRNPRVVITVPSQTFTYGDLDGDGEINYDDFKRLVVHVSRNEKLEVPEAADFNEDGVVDDADILILAIYLGVV